MPLDALRARLATVAHLEAAVRVLEWDQETFMPSGAAEARAEQLATLRTLAHEHFVAEETARLLADAEPDGPLDEALIRVTRRDLERQVRLPSALVRREAQASAQALEAWKAAREADGFSRFAPHLNRLLEINREKADCWGAEPGNRYDPLLDGYEPGTTGDDVAQVFADLRAALVPLIQAVAERPQVDDDPVRGPFDPDRQWAFGLAVAERFGYDLRHGRQDRSAHPFTTAFSPPFDVRITTRLDPGFFPTAFYGTLHEAGHALYEQGFDPALAHTPLADGASLGMHESQSRLWENQVGRSRPFWERHFGEVQELFPERLRGVSVEAFWKATNRVEPSLIRVEADELTYHLHVLLRFELERAMVEGDLAAADLPGAWREKMRAYLGVEPETDADGCLQDIHWAMGAFGYFPTYTLGTLMSAQLWDAIGRDLAGGDAESLVDSGDYGAILGWLREKIHRHGRALTAPQLLEAATGSTLDAAPWLAYARRKAEAVYGVSG
jgi:carboxypeptidase Taq